LKACTKHFTHTTYNSFISFCCVGLYVNYGDIVPLPKIMELKEKYKYRIMLDDSYGIGVLGKKGRGVCEHYGIDVSIQIENENKKENRSAI
jgi:7-keto-8-aminopelargonate synthetase-like enzyme